LLLKLSQHPVAFKGTGLLVVNPLDVVDEFTVGGGSRALRTHPPSKQRKFRESTKELTGKPHDVPLSRQAVAFLRELKKQTGDGRYLFPGRKGRPISTNALEVALNSLGYLDTHCPHGFRSSASTLLNAERITVDGTDLPPPVAAARPL
jgi:integrase